MSSILCTCGDKSNPDVTSCAQCTTKCEGKGGIMSCTDTNAIRSFFGMSMAVFFFILVIYILLLIGMITWSIHTMKICNGNPSWLNPTIIVLLVLWILAFPISPLIFVALLIILIIFSGGCKSKK